MELVKDIYFNTDKLIENTDVKVSYTGKFYQGNNEKVFLHYGYGKDWNNVNDIEMIKTDLGYQAELNLTGKDTVNFCFKNQNNEWDNNLGQNYIFNIEKPAVTSEKNENSGNLVFWGKTFGKNDEMQTSSNVYWTSENNNQANNLDENTSGVIEDVINSTPNSIDTIISNKAENVVEPTADFKKSLGVTLETPVEKDCFAIIKTSSDNSNIENASNSNVSNTVIGSAATKQQTAIALAPTGFASWTKKIKENVCKFFDYLPKLISGNYKRNIDNNFIDKI